MIIDYKIGGGGALGWRELAAKAKPDGDTIAGFNIPHVILQPLQQDVGYRTDQIVPVFIFHKTPLALAVLQTSPYQTMKDLVDHAKKNPGAVTVGGAGTFSGYHMATLRFEKLSGTKLTYVPFTGAAPQMTSFLGGHVVAVFGATDNLTRYRGKVRVLGFATEKRFPGSPTLRRSRNRGSTWWSIMIDHDAVDGEYAARFMGRLGELLQEGYGLKEIMPRPTPAPA